MQLSEQSVRLQVVPCGATRCNTSSGMPATTMQLKRHSLSDVASSVSVERYRHALQDGIKMQGALTALSMHGNVERQNTEKPKGPLHASTPQSMGRVLRLRWFGSFIWPKPIKPVCARRAKVAPSSLTGECLAVGRDLRKCRKSCGSECSLSGAAAIQDASTTL